jgi:hypothetical protein
MSAAASCLRASPCPKTSLNTSATNQRSLVTKREGVKAQSSCLPTSPSNPCHSKPEPCNPVAGEIPLKDAKERQTAAHGSVGVPVKSIHCAEDLLSRHFACFAGGSNPWIRLGSTHAIERNHAQHDAHKMNELLEKNGTKQLNGLLLLKRRAQSTSICSEFRVFGVFRGYPTASIRLSAFASLRSKKSPLLTTP